MLAWISANWLYVTIGAALLIAIANKVSAHWSDHAGVKRWALFVVELLSILTSRGSSLVGPFKPPLLSVPPKTVDPVRVKLERP